MKRFFQHMYFWCLAVLFIGYFPGRISLYLLALAALACPYDPIAYWVDIVLETYTVRGVLSVGFIILMGFLPFDEFTAFGSLIFKLLG